MMIDKEEIMEEEHYLVQRIIQDYGSKPEMAFNLIAGANLCVKRMLDLLLEKEEAYCDRVATIVTRGNDVQ